MLAIVFVMTLFAGRLIQVQGFEAGSYRQLAVKEQDLTIVLPAVRGSITGADGEMLAMTVATYLVYADPLEIPAAQQQQVADSLAGPLDMTAADNPRPHPAPVLAAVRGAGQGCGRAGP